MKNYSTNKIYKIKCWNCIENVLIQEPFNTEPLKIDV